MGNDILADNPISKFFIGIWNWIKKTWNEFITIIYWIAIIFLAILVWHYFYEFMYPTWAAWAVERNARLKMALGESSSIPITTAN